MGGALSDISFSFSFFFSVLELELQINRHLTQMLAS